MTEMALKQEIQELYDKGCSKYRIQKTLNLTKKKIDDVAAEMNLHFISRKEIQQRNQKMLELRNQKWSLESIGEVFTVNGRPMTKEGVRLAIQNAVAAGGTLKVGRGKSLNRENKHTVRFSERRDETIRMYLEGTPESAIAKKLGVCEKTISSYLRDLPEYKQKHHAKNQPIKSALEYSEIIELKRSGKSPADIAALAGISVPRVLQIIQLQGDYNPSKKTVQKIKRVVAAREDKKSIREIAKRESVTDGQIYRYINLAKVLKDSGKI